MATVLDIISAETMHQKLQIGLHTYVKRTLSFDLRTQARPHHQEIKKTQTQIQSPLFSHPPLIQTEMRNGREQERHKAPQFRKQL